MMRIRTASFVRVSAIIVSALAVIVAVFALVPGVRYYNDANELVRIEPAFPHVLAVGALAFAAIGGLVARWPAPSLALVWIAAGAGGVVLWISNHLLDDLFLHGESSLASNIAGGVALLGVVVAAALGITSLVIICLRAIKQLRTPAATAPALHD